MGGLLGGMLGTQSKYKADENAYNRAIDESQGSSLGLQEVLRAQMLGGGPNLAQQQFQNATQQLQQQAAGQIGAIKGISPAAQARMLQQQQSGIAQGLAGESALQRMQQQLAAQQMLGQQSLGMFDVASGRKLGAQQVNAGTAAANAENSSKLVGGLLGGGGGALSAGGLLRAEGGVIGDDGPKSELGRAIAGMPAGEVFMADGGVPGSAPVPGNSYANDKVPAMLSPGEVVIPRTHATPEGAASFVQALQNRSAGYGRVAAARMACGGRVGYAQGGEVESASPGLWERAKGMWEKVSGATPEDVGRKLPESVGGGFADLVAARKRALDNAGKE